MAEEEILQARISELTTENTTIEAAKCELMSKMEELTARKVKAEVVSADLQQERESLDRQKGMYTRTCS